MAGDDEKKNGSDQPDPNKLDVPEGNVSEKVRKLSGDAPTTSKAKSQLEFIEAQQETKYEIWDDDVQHLKILLTNPERDPKQVDAHFTYMKRMAQSLESHHTTYINALAKERQFDKLKEEERKFATFLKERTVLEAEVREAQPQPDSDHIDDGEEDSRPDPTATLKQHLAGLQRDQDRLQQSILKLEEDLRGETPNLFDIQSQHDAVSCQAEEFFAFQLSITNELLHNNWFNEYDQMKQIRSQLQQRKSNLDRAVKRITVKDTPPPPTPATSLLSEINAAYKRQEHLPKFSGNVREWLTFWATFQQTHTSRLPVIEKFKLLVISTTENSAARKLINSFPMTEGNYQAAIDSLKDRFGRENVLTKVYVRDLLQLVISTATGKKLDFIDLVTQITSQVRNLEQLGVTSDRCADVLYPVVESCLNESTLLAWQRSPSHREELSELIKFLQHEVNYASERKLAHFSLTTNPNQQQGSGSRNNNQSNNRTTSKEQPTASSLLNATGSSSSSQITCLFCSGLHYSNTCKTALTMPYSARLEKLKATGRCFICFRKNHTSKSCDRKSTTKCSGCGGAHQLVMCPKLPQEQSEVPRFNESASSAVQPVHQNPPPAPVPASAPPNQPQQRTTTANLIQTAEVPLQTLLLTSVGRDGSPVKMRAVLDSASQSSYIRAPCSDILKYKSLGEEQVIHQVFGGSRAPFFHQKIELVLADHNGDLPFRLTLSTVPKITEYQIPPSVSAGSWMRDFAQKGIVFTDLAHLSTEVDLLLGNDVLPYLYTGRIEILPAGPAAMETKWGWVLGGTFPTTELRESSTSSLINTLLVSNSISELWSLEVIGITDSAQRQSKAELKQKTQEHFTETVTRLSDGRYQVQLPFLEGRRPTLPSNYSIALNCLQSITRVLQKDGHLQRYHSVFLDWEQRGIIERVPHVEGSATQCHFLPHRHVLKLSSTTTPIRPVFDASSKAKGKPSLNECLKAGPNLLELIPALLTRFRLHEFAATADIAKAFLQIAVHPPHRDFLRFLWWTDESCTKLQEFRHCRVVFGVSSSPFLLAATINHHLEQVPSHQREIASILSRALYVDNALVSLPTLQEIERFRTGSCEILTSAQFDLRDWVVGPHPAAPPTSVLGLIWNPSDDSFSLDLTSSLKKLDGPSTPRDILAIVHSPYDPLGFVAPFTLLGKLLLRQSHDAKITWKNSLSEGLQQSFNKWKAQIPVLSQLKFPRHVNFGSAISNQLHVFTDASETSYAAAVFLRTELENGSVHCTLLQAKSRLSPREITIPRLELLSCLIGARLGTTVMNDMQVTLPIYFWNDSSVALAWIKGDRPWATFVDNRVQEIRRLTDINSWSHVPGILNPADVFSRGCSAAQLLQLQVWNGPDWLTMPQIEWPSQPEEPNESEVVKEMKKTVTTAVATVTPTSHPFHKFLKLSNYDKILLAIAYWKRCVSLLKIKRAHSPIPPELKSPPSTEELQEAETALIKFIQLPLHDRKDWIRNLKPFIDDNGILRTRTRLTHRDAEGFLTPIILPEKNPFVDLLISSEHDKTCHAGTQTLLGHLRERFWIVNGRRTVRSALNNCWICLRFNAKRLAVPEGPLPAARTSSGAPFSVIGVDMAGPLILKDRTKVWVAVFTCAKYRAIHLEVVDTLSTDGFLSCFRRFVARRGKPSTVFSDSGLNFVGANRVITHQRQILKFANSRIIKWNFSPSAAPWWCGFVERMVGVMKSLLRRILGNKVVRLPELTTLLAEVEEVANNRPLTYMSENPEDLIPLTPNHFVRNSFLSYVPELDLHDASHVRAAFRKLQHLREALQSRWRKEYLGLLQFHHSNELDSPPLKIGDVVLIEDDNRKRLDWPLATVTATMPSSDGKTRVYRLKTKTGEIIRPARRLFPMEISEPETITSPPSSE